MPGGKTSVNLFCFLLLSFHKWFFLVLANGDNQITTLPYQMKALPDGLHVCHSGKVVQANAIIKPFYDSLVFSAIPSPGNRQVTAFDELSVTMK